MGSATWLDRVRWWMAGMLFTLAGKIDSKYDVWLDTATPRGRNR